MTRRSRFNRRTQQPNRDPYASIVRALAPYSFIEADTYRVDPATGKVAAFVDKVAPGTGIRAITANHEFAQATSARQVAVPVPDSLFANKYTATFASQWYDSNSAATNWKFIHAGPVEIFHVFSLTSLATIQSMLSTTDDTGSGLDFYVLGGAGNNISARIYNATPTLIINVTTGALSTSTAYYADMTFDTSLTPDAEMLLKTSSTSTGNIAAAVSSGDPVGTLRLGNRRDAGAAATMKWVSTIIFSTVAAGNRTAVRDFFTKKYGVT